MTMPNWEALRTFVAVARAKTARNAAKTLKVHHSTVGRHLEQLEKSMNTRLFDRHPDGYVLTSSGETLFEVVSGFEEKLTKTSREVSGTTDRLSGVLRATMPGPIATSVFAPKLSAFNRTYPGIELEIVSTFQKLDIARGEADIAIRMDNNPPTRLVGRRLFKYHEAPYATPEYLRNHDLLKHPQSARLLGWEDGGERFPARTKGTGCDAVPVWGFFPQPEVQLGAAKAGLGIAFLPCLIADQEPDLVRATPHPPKEALDIWLLTRPDLSSTLRVRTFMDFAEELLVSLEPALQGS